MWPGAGRERSGRDESDDFFFLENISFEKGREERKWTDFDATPPRFVAPRRSRSERNERWSTHLAPRRCQAPRPAACRTSRAGTSPADAPLPGRSKTRSRSTAPARGSRTCSISPRPPRPRQPAAPARSRAPAPPAVGARTLRTAAASAAAASRRLDRSSRRAARWCIPILETLWSRACPRRRAAAARAGTDTARS
eukprot:30898-Pelagococcus_subviridis.AAC.10